MTETDTKDMAPCLIFIDKEGVWHHKGVEMVRRDFIRLFYQNMELDPDGCYVINWGGKPCYVEVEDTAFVVRNVHYVEDSKGEEDRFVLSLSDDTNEDLMPETLYVGDNNVMYCSVKNAVFPARFNRTAYYELVKHIEEKNDSYYLPVSGRDYEIKGISE
ncbi:conserved hypothetical protein [uncultured Desulfobacterium sp.]|uniref:DUF1285 domain-containing protein n=1 Tax=uncultured Desulfobacterium sp. TaxID=201089 RepID=A0A445MR15_9BACT|nr:conserved hypothetical protein [uncultured Desulfobacterium sp.]